MARDLTSIPDIQAPDADYPNGRIQNEDAPIVGTPIIEELYGDIIQFFHKLMRVAGLSHNGLPENETQGFQFITALQSYIRTVASSTTQRGVVELADNAETQAGVDSQRVVTPAGLESKTATETRKGIVELASNAETQAGTISTLAVTPTGLQSCTSTETRRGIAEIATNAEINQGTDNQRIVTPAGLEFRVGGLSQTIINIGAWNMDTTPLLNVPHLMTFNMIRAVTAFVFDDASSYCKNLLSGDNSNYPGSVSWDATNIQLYRGSLFDNTNFNDSVMNRGYIIIQYVPFP